jgi:hypothetical protein
LFVVTVSFLLAAGCCIDQSNKCYCLGLGSSPGSSGKISAALRSSPEKSAAASFLSLAMSSIQGASLSSKKDATVIQWQKPTFLFAPANKSSQEKDKPSLDYTPPAFSPQQSVFEPPKEAKNCSMDYKTPLFLPQPIGKSVRFSSQPIGLSSSQQKGRYQTPLFPRNTPESVLSDTASGVNKTNAFTTQMVEEPINPIQTSSVINDDEKISKAKPDSNSLALDGIRTRLNHVSGVHNNPAPQGLQ